jgi:hypothetical protein
MSGLVFPRGGPRSTVSRAEVAVYEALVRGLPAGSRAWHSLRVRTRRGWEGEGDFVIAAPERGLLVLEVKGGAVRLADGIWYQGDRRMDTPPRDQANGYVRLLVDAMRERGCEVPPYGVACAFPDVDFTDGPAAGDLDGLVIGRRQLAWLGEALPGLVDRALPHGLAPPRSRKWIDVLHELWGETWVPTVSVADQVRAADERLVALDSEQLRVLDLAGQNTRALVEGGAGSGKSLLARELCVSAAKAGRTALYVCFTDALGRALDAQLSSSGAPAGRARAVPIRRYAAELLAAAGRPVRADDSKFWAEASLEAACGALPARRPDLVVVDEAQDLEESDWALVEELSRGGDLWVFADVRQAFWTDRPIPSFVTHEAVRLTLGAQKRNPPGIWRLASSYAGNADEPPAASDGSVRVIAVAPDELARRLRHEITELRRKGARPGDIAVLTLAGQTLSQVLKLDRVGEERLVRADTPDAPAHIVADTFLRFKGLERPFVILTELAVGRISKYETRMHIALTRATVQVLVLATPEHLAEDPRLAALASRTTV